MSLPPSDIQVPLHPRGGLWPFEATIRPPPPALGHPGNRKQPLGFIAITGVDAKYISDGEIMIGSLDDPDLISGAPPHPRRLFASKPRVATPR